MDELRNKLALRNTNSPSNEEAPIRSRERTMSLSSSSPNNPSKPLVELQRRTSLTDIVRGSNSQPPSPALTITPSTPITTSAPPGEFQDAPSGGPPPPPPPPGATIQTPTLRIAQNVPVQSEKSKFTT